MRARAVRGGSNAPASHPRCAPAALRGDHDGAPTLRAQKVRLCARVCGAQLNAQAGRTWLEYQRARRVGRTACSRRGAGGKRQRQQERENARHAAAPFSPAPTKPADARRPRCGSPPCARACGAKPRRRLALRTGRRLQVRPFCGPRASKKRGTRPRDGAFKSTAVCTAAALLRSSCPRLARRARRPSPRRVLRSALSVGAFARRQRRL